MSQLRYRLSFPGGSTTVEMPNDELIVANFPDAGFPLPEREDWVVNEATLSSILVEWEQAIVDGMLADAGGYEVSEGRDGNEYAVAFMDPGTPNLIQIRLIYPDSVFSDAFATVSGYHLGELPFTVTVEDETGQLYDEFKAGE